MTLASLSGQEVPQDDLPDEMLSGKEVPPEDLPSGSEVPAHDLHDSQSGLAAVEGLVRGTVPGADLLASGMRKGASAIGVPDKYLDYVAPSTESLSRRQEENPMISGGAELAGNVGLMNRLPQIGSKAIDGLIKMGIISGNDEVSKSVLGHGDPVDAAANHIAGSAMLGYLTGGLFGKMESLAGKGLKAIESQKWGARLPSFLSGAGHAASFPGEELGQKAFKTSVGLGDSALIPEETEGLNEKAFKIGQKFFNEHAVKTPKIASRIAAPVLGNTLGGFGGAIAASALERYLEKLAPKASQKYLAPVLLKAAASGTTENLADLIDHASRLGRGVNKISNGVESVFNAASNKAVDYETSDHDREKLKKFIEEGGTNEQVKNESQGVEPQGFAEGGDVGDKPQNPMETVFPEQHMILTATKHRVSNFLNTKRPMPNPMKAPYDNEQEDHHQKRQYHKALDMALNPLSVLKHIKNGTLLPDQVSDFKQMYPELHTHLSKKLTERMMKGHLKGDKKPPYKTRQSLSLFLGSDLDSSLSPQNIQAAQNVFVQQQAQRQAVKSAASLSKMGKSMQTAEQSRTQKLNKN